MISPYLYKKYQEELQAVLPELKRAHETLAKSKSPKLSSIRQEVIDGQVTGSIAGLTPFPDAIYLYLLVREYKPKKIFEIGTWVGTSALFMAEAIKKNGYGHIYTCDTNQYYVLSDDYADFITYMPGHSDEILTNFKEKKAVFDFVFIDGNLTSQTRQLLAQTTHEQTVFAIHDFLLPDDKGIQAFLRLPRKKNYGLAVPNPYQATNLNTTINKMTAVYLPINATSNMVVLRYSLSLKLYRLFLSLSYIIGHAATKLRSLFKRR